MSVFSYSSYKPFCQELIRGLPKQGHGELVKIAKVLNVNPALISQIVNGKKDFTLEQGFEVANYFGLPQSETDYFILLLERDRAGSHKLRQFFEAKINRAQLDSRKIVNRVTKDREMTDIEKAIFYSSWIYSAVRLLTTIEGFRTIDAIAGRLQLSRSKTAEVMRFLVAHGLCSEDGGKYSVGAQRTHLEIESPFLARHQMSWRTKASQKLEDIGERELAFTAPLTISMDDAAKFRGQLLDLIQKLSRTVKDTRAEALYCFNIDFFEVR